MWRLEPKVEREVALEEEQAQREEDKEPCYTSSEE